jgi:hypothetical protein
MRKIFLGGLAALALTVAPAHADELAEEGRYDVTIGNPVVGLSINACPDLCFGGYIFAAPGLTPTRVVVEDTSGLPVGFTVGQDFDGDGFSGGDGEPSVEACGGEADLSTSEVAFDPGKQVAVFVDLISLDCEGVGTNGTIDLYVAS